MIDQRVPPVAPAEPKPKATLRRVTVSGLIALSLPMIFGLPVALAADGREIRFEGPPFIAFTALIVAVVAVFTASPG